LDGIRANPAVQAIVGDAPWLAVLGRLLLVKLRTWVMPLVVAGLSALSLVLLVGLASVRRPARPAAAEPDASPPGASATVDDAPAAIDAAPVMVGSAVDAAQAQAGTAEAGRHAALSFVLLCAAAGLLLTLSVEYFYLIDNFMVRMNTIFKFYFQAWVLMALASAFAVYWLGRREPSPWPGRATNGLRRLALAGFWLLFALGMIYPVLGNISRAGNFDHKPTLDGTAYLASSQPDDYAAIQWLNDNVADAPVILETPAGGGDSYDYKGRVAALTGLPTLLGWAGHEAQWRGSYTVQAEREPDIRTLYTTPDVELARTLLDAYDITYVYVGPLERSTYDPRGLDKFSRFMAVVYQQGEVTIYKR
jgi:YYY domain-containing protein